MLDEALSLKSGKAVLGHHPVQLTALPNLFPPARSCFGSGWNEVSQAAKRKVVTKGYV